MKVLKTIAILLPLLLSSTEAFASLTDVDPQDKSVEYLRYIFGDTVNVITGGNGPTDPDSILGAISEILNVGMLVFTGLVVGYVFLTGVLNSASEGNPLGKAYSTMWIPLRMVLSLALVLPFSGGYSTMQIGVLWTAGHGIGLANSTWNRALDYMSASGTLYPPNVSIDHESIASSMLESRVCMHGINTADRHVNIEDDPVELVNNDSVNTIHISGETENFSPPAHHKVSQRYSSVYNLVEAAGAYTAAWVSDFSAGVPRSYGVNPCGSITLEFAEIDEGVAIESPVISFQQSIIEITADLDEDMDPIARSIVNYAVDETQPQPDLTAFNSAVQTFKTQYEDAVNSAMSGIATIRINKWAGGNPDTSGSSLGARDAGWISAGAWYWDFQRINAETQEMVSINPSRTGPTPRAKKNDDYLMFESAFESYISNMMVEDQYGNTVTAMERSSYADDNNGLSVVLATAKKSLDLALADPDPISGLANFGHTIITVFEGLYITLKGLELIAQTADDGAEALGGLSGGAARLVSSPAFQIAEGALGMLIFAGFLLLPLAIMLAFYLPATPFILWIMGVVGWLVLLIEAVIAAPIWAMSHSMPEGNGFVGQRAMAGYMVILSLFLRPTLMLFGFFASMVLMIVMGKVVGLLFIPAMSSASGDHLSGLFSLFAMLGIFTVLMIQIAHRVYGLIHEVPDKVLRYIGGGAENLGEASHEQQNRSIFVGGVAKIASHGDKAARGTGASGGSSITKGIGKAAGAASSGMSKMSKMLSTK